MKRKGLILGLLFIVLFGQIKLAQGANTRDTAWGWDIPWYNLEKYTELRPKENSTPIYFFVDYIYRDNNQGSLKLTIVNSQGAQFTNGYKFIKYASNPGKYCLNSNAYEDAGYGVQVKVRGDRIDSSRIQASGQWRPDSSVCP